MKAASLKEIKTELNSLPPDQLVELCVHLTKYKKENKELLTYLLFEADDESVYVQAVKDEINVQFKEVNRSNSYLAKKTIRKILRIANKYTKFSGNRQTEIEVLIHFCLQLKKVGISMPINSTIGNIYLRQFQKIHKLLATLHEDLQADFADELRLL
ncbi:hypothetical protein [Williamwhitmania taraxaci]|uniref:Uncharacterized protein n=1 Tax=Williamwhitmania taraxaci TaxID=1640674 RepID=A0A1G6S8J2_9BACT|nr:hypothetical protein [Williamwhitmania taraxaci]SDD12984.1 hypothetical protein SAMN05216323_10899 [Williamwhitmania taraxaci]